MERSGGLSLLCRVDARLCAVPLESVVETTRLLRIEPVAGAPACVLGLSVVRGSALPVVDVARLLSGGASSSSRLVVLRVGERRVGLAVDDVLGVRSVNAGSLEALPPLLTNANAEAVSAIGTLDSELLMLLQAARIVPEELLQSLQAEALAS